MREIIPTGSIGDSARVMRIMVRCEIIMKVERESFEIQAWRIEVINVIRGNSRGFS